MQKLPNMETVKAPIQFVNFLVKESYISFTEIGDYKIKIDFDAKAIVNQNSSNYHLFIETIISEEGGKLNVRINSESIFNYDNQIDIEELKNGLFTKNAPAIVFPYIRAYIASITALSGVPTLNLPTLNMIKLGEDLRQKINVQ